MKIAGVSLMKENLSVQRVNLHPRSFLKESLIPGHLARF